MSITRTIKFTCYPPSSEPLQLEVSYDNGDTWQPFTFMQENKMSGIDEKNGWSIGHWPSNYDSDWTEWYRDKVYNCQHKWIDTGMRKTYCKECDAEGDYDPMTGHVTLIERPINKEEKK